MCRGCGIKSVTSNRSCWSCNKTNIRSEDLVTDKLLRKQFILLDVVVVYLITIVAIRMGMVVGCVLRTAESSII